ncbi:B3 domain-containing transcription factor VRN1 [Vitis vinifera]|uniref:B3 domain-containing transcription factor VRN1 n=1 Tax=Vitis vinifera TaxID=29760 RepID=A0A438FD06_VITVI|nr:B3 domain-containing transcription factor VRN1 [Vitis vinifera]
MTSFPWWHCEEGLLPSTISATRPHFFKIIHSTILRDGTLGIPKRFVSRYGKNLSNIMFLKVPSGAVWQVGLKRGDGEVWLDGGWREFVEYYSIGTASEIEYPSTNAPHYEEPSSNIGGSLPLKMEEIDNDVSVEILDVFPARQTTKEKDTINISSSEEEFTPVCPKLWKLRVMFPLERLMFSLQARIQKRKEPKGVGATGVKFEKSGIDADLLPGTSGLKVGHDFHAKESCGTVAAIQGNVLSGVLPPVTASKEVGALQRAIAFNPENPFFRAKMGPSYLGPSRHGLNIPIWFVERYFKTDDKSITLWGSDGRTWSTSYRLGRRRNGKRVAELLYSGWKIFVQDNQLKLGDVCVFVLIKSPGILLKVVIFGNSGDADH